MEDNTLKQISIKGIVQYDRYFSIIESLLFVSGEPLKIKDISRIIGCSYDKTKDVINDMKSNYEEDDRGIEIMILNNSCQLVTKRKNSLYVQKLLNVNARQSLSNASLETLAIISYKQPITRIEIDEIRGVKSDSAVATLLQKNLIQESGRKDVVGRPILYSTTDEFLRYFGLSKLEDMPKMEYYEQQAMEEKGDKE